MADEYAYEDEYGYEEDDDNLITSEDCWQVISSFFDEKGLVSQQIDSFDEFCKTTLGDITKNSRVTHIEKSPKSDDDESIIERQYHLDFTETIIGKPIFTEGDGSSDELYPHEARLRNLTYSSPVWATVKKRIDVCRERVVEDAEGDGEGGQRVEQVWEREDDPSDESNEARVFIGKVPIMLKSHYCRLNGLTEDELYGKNECPYDQGGYFIINGSEKVLIAQERSAANIVQVFHKKGTPTPWIAEIRSAVEKGSRLLSTTQVKLFSKGEASRGGHGACLKMTLPYTKSDIPIGIVFRALGVVSDEDIVNHICYDRTDTEMMEMLKPSLEEAFMIQDEGVAQDWIGRRGTTMGVKEQRIRNTRNILQREFLPHISMEEGSETKKAYFLGYMIHRLLQCALGRREEDDRDHFGKKRLDLAGPLIASLFRYLCDRMKKDLQRMLARAVDKGHDFNIHVATKNSTITNGLKYSLATGNWGDQKKAASAKAGVSQVLNRYTFASTLSHLRRTNTPIGRDGKIAKPRQLHNTHWGLVCPAETPEGQACGLVKNLSLMCYVAVGSSAGVNKYIVDYMTARNMELLEEYDPRTAPNATKIFVNGVWVGVHRDPGQLAPHMQSLRGSMLDPEISMIRDIRDREFKIFTDAGRVCRPLFKIDNNPSSPNRGNLVLKREHIEKLIQEKDMGDDIKKYSKKEREEYGIGWTGLLKEGVVEYVDAEEEEAAMIVMTPDDLTEHHLVRSGQTIYQTEVDPHSRVKLKPNPSVKMYTHCEIHPAMLLGICASIIPFPDHNQVCWNVCALLDIITDIS